MAPPGPDAAPLPYYEARVLGDRLGEVLDALREDLLDEPDLMDECGQCGCYHRRDFTGECRNDLERL